MNRLITLCLSAVLAAGSIFAASPAKRVPPQGSPQPQGTPALAGQETAVRYGALRQGVGANADTQTKRQRLMSGLGMAKSPLRVGASGATVYGNLIADWTWTYPNSVSEIFSDAQVKPLFNAPQGTRGGDFQIVVMYVRDDKIYCLGQETFWGQDLLGFDEYVYDLETGEQISHTPYGDQEVMFSFAGYDPVKDMLYGYVNTSAGIYYCTAPGENPRGLTPVAKLPDDAVRVNCMTYNQITGKLIGITNIDLGGKVLEISTTDGSQTEIGTVANPSKYVTGLCYSPWDEAYWYAMCTDSGCAIQLLDPEDFSVISSAPYPGLIEFCGLFCPDRRKIPASAPGDATLVSTNFRDGSLSGSLLYQLPSATFGGNPILGNISWVLYVDEVEAKRGNAAAGSEVKVSVSDLSEGVHTFKFICSLAGNEGKEIVTTFYVGNDTPKAPATVTLTSNTISWTPVTEGVHEGYVNAEAVTYNVYVNGKEVAHGIKDTECSPKLPAGEQFTDYIASVEAVFDGKVSEKTNSNDIRYGEAISLPMSYEPTEKESRLFTIYNANGDDKAIFFTHFDYGSYSDVPLFRYDYSSANNADDWLYLPLARFDDANAVYEFRMNAFRTDRYTETVEVALCSAPDGKSIIKKILEPFNLENERTDNAAESADVAFNQYFTANFTVPSAGNYYVGIHVISPADQFSTFLRDFSLRKYDGVVKSAPDAVSELKAVAAPGGALNAVVTFTFPSTAADGTAYSSDATLTATAQAAGCEAATVSGKPGEAATVTVPTKQGNNTVTVAAKDGDKTGIPSEVAVYTGLERPGTVENLKVEVDATDYTAHITWTAPAEGVNGGYVAPTGITYYFCEYVTINGQSGWKIKEPIGKDVFEYDYTIPEGTPQSLVDMGIIAENSEGMADFVLSTSAVMGKPYETSVNVVCNNQDNLPKPILTYGNGWSLNVGDPGSAYMSFRTDDNRRALYTRSTSFTSKTAKYSLPKFSTKNFSNPAIKLSTYGSSTSEFSVSVAAYGIDSKVVKTFKSADFAEKGPQDVVVELGSEFADKDWVEISFTAKASWSETFILYGYKIYDNIPYDFGVYAIEGPSDAKIGEEAKYVAHVLNYGNAANLMPASNWKLTDASGNLIASVDVAAGTENVEPDGELTFDIAFTPTADDMGELKLTYTIEKADAKVYNDSMTKEVSVSKGLTPVVTDLKAKDVSYDNVVLEWTAPESGVVESFEEVTPFRLDDATDMIGQFRRVDGDGLHVYGLSSDEFANIPGAGGPSSFLCWNKETVDEILGGNSILAPKTGNQFLIAFCPGEPDGNPQSADDWLISPEVVAGSDFSLSIRPITYQYGFETVEIMYSTTGDKPSDFKVLDTLKVGEGKDPGATTVYEDYSFTLPADAKYFAIHYVSKDVFGIMIDDIMYSPAGQSAAITGYDVYRNGVAIATNAPCPDGTYDDTAVEADTDYTYMVVPVLSNGTKGLDSNRLNVRTTGVDGIVTDSNEAEYFDLNGLRVIGKPAPGVYIEKRGETTRKVIIAK